MKSVLISVKPKWCELIASGKKTIEVRKTRPKIDTPFKCYIYETKAANKNKLIVDFDGDLPTKYTRGSGKVIGEFVCDRIDRIQKRGIDDNFDYCYLSLNVFGNDDIEIGITDIKKSCISKKELNEYGKNAFCLHSWHISDLEIYDEPKELSEFKLYNSHCYYSDMGLAIPNCENCNTCGVKRPPQSWCYVEAIL